MGNHAKNKACFVLGLAKQALYYVFLQIQICVCGVFSQLMTDNNEIDDQHNHENKLDHGHPLVIGDGETEQCEIFAFG